MVELISDSLHTMWNLLLTLLMNQEVAALFVVHYSLFTIHYSLFTIHCSLFELFTET
jgi:hypothetical protein